MMNICTLIDFEKENVSYSKFSASGAGDPGAIMVIAYPGEDKPVELEVTSGKVEAALQA